MTVVADKSLNIGGTVVQNTRYGFDQAGRLGTVSDGDTTVSYTYGPDGTTWANLSFGAALNTRRTFDGLNRLSTILNASASCTVYSAAYSMNQANQRTTNSLADGGRWVYTYDELGQVISGKKYFSDGDPVGGAQFGYEFDTIGNRLSAQEGTPPAESTYTANNLNQYSQRTVSGEILVTGEALTGATVSVRLETNNPVSYSRGHVYIFIHLS